MFVGSFDIPLNIQRNRFCCTESDVSGVQSDVTGFRCAESDLTGVRCTESDETGVYCTESDVTGDYTACNCPTQTQTIPNSEV